MTAYYNEHDPYAAAWLRNLIDAGHIARGVVDERSIEDVRPRDLAGFVQCHFFAGIGVWSHALRRAGWRDDRSVWTGSCPCQPFSAAGARAGFADERHLWPAWHHLIRECRPAAVFGEQVASADSQPWIDLVHDDLEALGYAFGAVPFPAASVGAPHIRDRLYFVGHAAVQRHERRAAAGRQARDRIEQRDRAGVLANGRRARLEGRDAGALGHECAAAERGGRARLEGRDAGALGHECAAAERGGRAGALADHDHERCEGERGAGLRRAAVHDADRCGAAGRLADADGRHASAERQQRGGEHGQQPQDGGASFWSDADWIACRDGKARPVEPGTFPLAHGAPARVGRLRAYGNAIVAEAAAAFVRAAA